MQVAAAIAAMFHLDPVVVLEESSQLCRDVRLAAHNAVVTERNRQTRAAQSGR